MGADVGDEVTANRLAEAEAILERHGRSGDVAAIRARHAMASDEPATVVVVGEAKRGKSSLINALLGVPEIAPTGTDIVTGAFVAYVPASVSHEVASGAARIHFADGTHEDVAFAEVAEWVTVDGARATDDRGVIGATVHLGSPGPLELVLIDTPGVSGLVAGHGKIALRMASQAAALVFVSDVGQDFTAPEAAFLAEATAEVDTVVFTFAKIDKHPVSWEKVVAHDHALLAEHVPRFTDAPMLGVSALLAVDALSEPDPQVAKVLQEESRIGQLVDTLHEVVASRAGQLALSNTLRATVSQLQEVEADLTGRLATIKDPARAQQQIGQERDELKELQQRRQTWPADFQAATQRVRRSLVVKLESHIGELENEWNSRVAALSDDVLGDQVQLLRFCGELAEVLENDSNTFFEGHLADVTKAISDVVDRDTERFERLRVHIHEIDPETVSVAAAANFNASTETGQPLGEILVQRSLMGFGAANMAGGLGAKALGLGAAATSVWFLLPVAAAAAAGLTFLTHKRAKISAVRQQLRNHTAKAIGRLRTDVLGRADGVISELQPALGREIREHFQELEQELEERMKAATTAARAEERDRKQQAATLERQLKAVAAARAQLEAVLKRRLAEGPGAGSPQRLPDVSRSLW